MTFSTKGICLISMLPVLIIILLVSSKANALDDRIVDGTTWDIESGDDFLYNSVSIRNDGEVIQTGGWNRLEPDPDDDLLPWAVLSVGWGGGEGTYTLDGGYLRMHGDIAVDNGEIRQSGGSVWVESSDSAPYHFLFSGGNIYLGLHQDYEGSKAGYYYLNGGDLRAENEIIGGDSLEGGVGPVLGELHHTGGINTVENLILAERHNGIGEYHLSGGNLNSGHQVIGQNGIGFFNHIGGGLNDVNGNLVLGENSGSSGTYTLRDLGYLRVDGNTIVGERGYGSFTNENATHTSSELIIGYQNGGSGHYTLGSGDFPGGILEVSTNEFIGYFGQGTFDHNRGTNNAGIIYLGAGTGSHGEYNLYGSSGYESSVIANHMFLGYTDGNGVFYHGTNANVTLSGDLGLGVEESGTGQYLLGGTLKATREAIGYSGYGRFTQSEGSSNTTESLYIGHESTGSGLYVMRGGTLFATQEHILRGSFQQTGGVNQASTIQIGTGENGGETKGRYSLGEGTLDVTRRMTVETDGVLTYSGGTFKANFVYNHGTINFIGLDEPLVFTGNVDNLEGATFNMNNTESQTERAQIEFNGALEIARNSSLNIYNTDLVGNGSYTNNSEGLTTIENSTVVWNSNEYNYGTINVIDSEVSWGNFTNGGTYNSDMSSNFFESLVIQEMGYLIGGGQDSFVVGSDFLNYSTQYHLWDTKDSYLGFSGDGKHQFLNQILAGTFADDQNLGKMIWETMELLGGDLFLQGTDLFVTNLILAPDTLLSLDGLTLHYYNLVDLGGEFEFLNGGRLAAVPEPSTFLLLGCGLAGLAFIARRKKKQYKNM